MSCIPHLLCSSHHGLVLLIHAEHCPVRRPCHAFFWLPGIILSYSPHSGLRLISSNMPFLIPPYVLHLQPLLKIHNLIILHSIYYNMSISCLFMRLLNYTEERLLNSISKSRVSIPLSSSHNSQHLAQDPVQQTLTDWIMNFM